MTLLYKKVHNGWLVYRQHGTHAQHSHFKSRKAAKNFIGLMRKGLKPKSNYYNQSAIRVLTSEEYNRLKTEQKQKYYNVNRGTRNA